MVEPATGKRRELQLIASTMLHDFKVICEKHNLRYFLDYGTLLGAVRHNGFIPWDDDVDVVMPYADYMKFLEIAQEEFGDQYFLQTNDTDRNFHRVYTRMRKNGTTFMDEQNFGWDIHHGVWVDIFPLIEINNGWEMKYKQALIKSANYMLMDNYLAIHEAEFVKDLGKFTVGLLKCFYKISHKTRLKWKNKILRHVCGAKNKKHLAIVWLRISERYPKDVYENDAQVTFENETYNAPGLYDKKLRLVYGDYMQLPPEDKRRGHGGIPLIDLEKDYSFYNDPFLTKPTP